MSFFSLGKEDNSYAVLIDIGSASVLTAIIHSDSSMKHPVIIWSHREHVSLKNIESMGQNTKSVLTSLVNTSMLLDSEGRKKLTEYNISAKLTDIQCTVSAPWSYTVTKTINYKEDSPFLISKDLIKDLKRTIKKGIESDIKENEKLLQMGLKPVVSSIMDIVSNGYRVKDPFGNNATSLSLSRTTVVTQQYLIDAVDEIQEKIFSDIVSRKISFILTLFIMSKDVLHHVYDLCLVDVTYEATEIGIVRDGVLKYCTHIPFGSFSIAREISVITNVPLQEAFGYLHTDKPCEFIDNLPKLKKASIEKVFEAYITKLVKLFHETGDSLSIPKRISLHTDLNTESIFLDLIEKAVKRSIKTNPNITLISKEIIREFYEQTKKKTDINYSDTALLCSAQFFHNQKDNSKFEYT